MLCGVGGYFVDVVCDDALSDVRPIGVVGMEGVEESVG